MYSTICVWYIDHHPCEASVHTNSVFIDKAVDDEQLQETWTSKTWKRCPMRGNSERFSSKNPLWRFVCVWKWNRDTSIRVQIVQSKSEEMRRKTTEEERITREREKIALSLSLSFNLCVHSRVCLSILRVFEKSVKKVESRSVALLVSFRFVSRKKSKTP